MQCWIDITMRVVANAIPKIHRLDKGNHRSKGRISVAFSRGKRWRVQSVPTGLLAGGEEEENRKEPDSKRKSGFSEIDEPGAKSRRIRARTTPETVKMRNKKTTSSGVT